MERSLEQLRRDALAIFNAAVNAVDAANAVKRHVCLDGSTLEVAGRSYALAGFNNIYLIGAGKAVVPMAQAMEELLGARLAGGIVVTKYGQALPLQKILVIEAAHPIPDSAGLEGARQIAGIAQRASADDLIILLVSGGASALLPYPIDAMTLGDKQSVTQLLLRSGATIRETNAVRRHLSQIKGGKLAQLAYPAQLIALILSDVIGDALEDIASGPTAPDPTQFADCWEILRKYRLEAKIPIAVRDILECGAQGKIGETLKAGNDVFTRVQNVIVGSNRLATAAAKSRAENLGYRSEILSNEIAGESRDVARRHAAILKRAITEPAQLPACIISGGETTVTVSGDGRGGRNQEFALSAAIEIAGIEKVAVLSAGTDGIDGPTDAAGALVDGDTVSRGQSHGYDAAQFLARNNAYPYLHATGDLLLTGPTQTNVMDIQVMLAV